VPPRGTCLLCGDGQPGPSSQLWPLALLRGFVLYWKGALRVLNDKAYMGRIAGAVTLGVVLFLLLGLAAYFLIAPWVSTLVSWLPGTLASGLTILLGAVTLFFFAPVLAALFLFPVLDPLARLAETEALGFAPPTHPRGSIAAFWDSMDTGARILLLQVGAYGLCLPLFPFGVGAPLALALSAFLAGFTWLDYPAGRRGLSFRTKWAIARRNWALLTGFGLAFEIGLWIPFFNMLIVGPSAAVGVADLWFACRKGEARPLEPSKHS
jgi:uncharacterized protein involved in cysteine biosynthesis